MTIVPRLAFPSHWLIMVTAIGRHLGVLIILQVPTEAVTNAKPKKGFPGDVQIASSLGEGIDMKEKSGRITRVWLTMIRVSDMDRALRFYNEILGLPIALDARMFDHAEVGPDEPLAKIGMHATGKESKRRRRTGIVFDTDDIYALYERLKKHGVRFTLKPTKMPWGGVVADFLDPDNNELEVVQDPEHYGRDYSHNPQMVATTEGVN